MRKQKYARYPDIFGKYYKNGLDSLCNVARNNGMLIICARKPDMHVCAEIGLYGTSEAMSKTDAAWIGGGHKLYTKRSGFPFGVNLTLKKKDWVDRPTMVQS